MKKPFITTNSNAMQNQVTNNSTKVTFLRSFIYHTSLKYATVVLLHRIEADTHSCDNAYNQLYRTDDNESANLRLLIDKEQSIEHNKGNTDNQRTQTNELAKRLSVFFGHSLPMIPMERGNIACYIDDSKYGN